MVKSMTGYGRKTIKHRHDTIITTEIKTVNSRYLDIVSKIPRTLQAIDLDLKKVMKNYFKRGRVELYISLTGESLSSQQLHINWQLMDQFIDKMSQMQERYQLSKNIPIHALTEREELFDVYETDETDTHLYETILNHVKGVCDQVSTSRFQEGEQLKNDILYRTQKIKSLLQYIVDHHESEQRLYQERIKSRISKQLDRDYPLNESYFIQEIALLAEKGSIQEELTRLKSHLAHFDLTLSGEEEIGRKLDFIVQELNREVNTIGAKSISPKISEKTILIKSEIEKIKEQIQNVE